MTVQIEALFYQCTGLAGSMERSKGCTRYIAPAHRFRSHLQRQPSALPALRCAASAQGVHDRLTREWRRLDFFQFEAWLHAEVPRVACSACGKTSQIDVPWAREGSGFTALFEALALSLC